MSKAMQAFSLPLTKATSNILKQNLFLIISEKRKEDILNKAEIASKAPPCKNWTHWDHVSVVTSSQNYKMLFIY